jgi:hypothetical protein
MFTLRESTRWLTKKGRHDEAWERLKWIRADESQATIEEMEEVCMGVEMERRATEGLRPKGKTSDSPISTYRLSVYRTFRTRQLQTARHRINCLHSTTSYGGNCFRLLWTPIFQASRRQRFKRPSPHRNFWCRKSGRLRVLRSLPVRLYWPSEGPNRWCCCYGSLPDYYCRGCKESACSWRRKGNKQRDCNSGLDLSLCDCLQPFLGTSALALRF